MCYIYIYILGPLEYETTYETIPQSNFGVCAKPQHESIWQIIDFFHSILRYDRISPIISHIFLCVSHDFPILSRDFPIVYRGGSHPAMFDDTDLTGGWHLSLISSSIDFFFSGVLRVSWNWRIPNNHGCFNTINAMLWSMTSMIWGYHPF